MFSNQYKESTEKTYLPPALSCETLTCYNRAATVETGGGKGSFLHYYVGDVSRVYSLIIS